jgi:cytoskeleton protein RodZ
MTDENENLDDNSEEASEGPIAGERLAAARRELQIPLTDIAKELHLDEYKVRALESNDFDIIGAPVFAKGHLRKYAQLVKVDEADVMADYYRLTRSSAAQPVLMARPRPRQVMALGPWIAVIVVILIAAVAYWWFVDGESAVEAPAVEAPPVGEITPLPQQQVPLVEEAEIETDDTVTEETLAVQPPLPDPAPATTPAPIDDSLDTQMSIVFQGDCWTEISDASGRRLFFGLGKAGRTVNLSGEAPFNVLFGDAANVSIEINGTPFEVPAADRRGRTARLTISGS